LFFEKMKQKTFAPNGGLDEIRVIASTAPHWAAA
jgi:hypothetical protein